MLFPLYDYYYASEMSLEEVLKHYTRTFYLRKHGTDKAETVFNKVVESSAIQKLFEISYRRGIAPNHVDFISAINETMYFIIQSNETQALAVLVAAFTWGEEVNSNRRLKSALDLRDDALKIFKKYSIYGEMTEEEFISMIHRS